MRCEPVYILGMLSESHFPDLAKTLNRSLRRSEKSDCFEWVGFRNKAGYGLASNSIYRKHGTSLAHRLAYLCTHGELLPRELVIRHKCDNPSCCNPEHLIPGTRGENAADRDMRNRTSRGERHPNSKLKERDIAEIRASAESNQVLAIRYGVTKLTIFNIKHRKTWRHVA